MKVRDVGGLYPNRVPRTCDRTVRGQVTDCERGASAFFKDFWKLAFLIISTFEKISFSVAVEPSDNQKVQPHS